MNKAVITPAESDVFLAAYPDWLALDNSTKEAHIANASVYVQTRWTCDSVDFDNAPKTVKEAVAFYAYGDFKGSLYPSTTGGSLRMKRVKAGSVEVEKEFSSPLSSSTPSMRYAADLLGTECYQSGGAGMVDLTRN